MALRKRCLDCSNITNGGARCLACKQRTQRERNARRNPALRRQLRQDLEYHGGANCYICHDWQPAHYLELDHVVELEDGGQDDPANIRPACKRCHRRKSAESRRARRR